jgi:hypothetical protein
LFQSSIIGARCRTEVAVRDLHGLALKEPMDILSPEDRVVLWRAAIDAEGAQRETLVRAIAKEIYESLGALDLYADEYAQLTIESLRSHDAGRSRRAIQGP